MVEPHRLTAGYRLEPYQRSLLTDHAKVKHEAFADGLDTFVFHCLSSSDGCLRLMREIAGRSGFCQSATWLVYHDPPGGGQSSAVGTIQGLRIGDIGSIQNLAIVGEHRGRGLGSVLMYHAAAGFRSVGLSTMQLEVTSDNVGAVRLYQRLGLTIEEVVYKSAEVAD